MQCCGGFWYFLAILDCQIKKEVDMFDLRKANDFKRMLIKYLENMLKSQEKLNAQRERYLPEIKHISI